MAEYVGVNGSIVLAGTALTIGKRWRVHDEADKEDITGMTGPSGSRWKSYGTTLKGWTVEAEGVLDSSDTMLRGTSPALQAGVTCSFVGTITTGKAYSGILLVDSTEVEGAVDGEFTYSINGTGSGALVYPST